MIKKIKIIVVVFLMLASCKKEETIKLEISGTLKGSVYTSSYDKNGWNVRLYNDACSFNTTSDSKGLFQINNIPIGYYYLKVEKDSNYTYSLSRVPINGTNPFGVNVLKRSSYWLELIKYSNDTLWFISKPHILKNNSICFYISKKVENPDESNCEVVENIYCKQVGSSDTIFCSLRNYTFSDIKRYPYDVNGAHARFGLQEEFYSIQHYDSINHISYYVPATGKLTQSIVLK